MSGRRNDALRRLAEAIVELARSGTETIADDIRAACRDAGATLVREAGGVPVMRGSAAAETLIHRDRRSSHIDTFAAFLREPDSPSAAPLPGKASAEVLTGQARATDRPAAPERPSDTIDAGTRRLFELIISNEETYESFLAVALSWPDEWSAVDLGHELARHAVSLRRDTPPGSPEASAWEAVGPLDTIWWWYLPFMLLHGYAEAADDRELLARLKREHDKLVGRS